MSPQVSSSPPRAPPVTYTAPHGTRWAKEKAAAGQSAFDFPEDPKFIGPWIMGECVGKGASGRVRIAKHRTTGQHAAVKILPIQPLFDSRTSLTTKLAKTDKQRLGIDREIAMMKLMNHPNIMRIYDVYEGEKELFLVLEYVKGGELFDFLVNRGRLPPYEALCYFKQIVYGLNYAHTFSIIHRDLKPENILIHTIEPPLIKIADWGMAAFAPPTHKLDTSCGSPHYASPEIVNGERYNGTSTDIWSCGVILFALLTGRLPFDDKNIRHLLSKVKSGKFDIPTWMDPGAKDLISRMLVVDVAKRITIPEIMEHPWFQIPTEGIQHVPPPMPLEIAKPIASIADMDPYHLESLRIIWGRQTDPWAESIRKDLLSPVGEGTLAKAFYFLLSKYRDRVQQEYAESLGSQSPESINTALKQYIAPPPPNYLAFTTSRGDKRKSHSQPSQPTSTEAGSPVLASPIIISSGPTKSVAQNAVGSTRTRTSSPAGPRPQSHYPTRVDSQFSKASNPVGQSPRQPQSTTPTSTPRTSTVTPVSTPQRALTFSPHRSSVGPHQHRRFTQLPNATFLEAQTPPKSSTPAPIELTSPKLRTRPQSSSPIAPNVTWIPSTGRDSSKAAAGNRRTLWSPDASASTPKSNPATPVIHAPVPIPLAAPQPASVLTQQAAAQQKDENPVIEAAPVAEEAVEKPTVFGAGGNNSAAEKPSEARRLVRRNRIASEAGTSPNKENVSLDIDADSSWLHVNPVKPELLAKSLGESKGTKTGAVGVSEDRKPHNRPRAPSEALRPKRSTLASPILLSQPTAYGNSSRFVSSPHLADHKRGWFSQLFHRKTHHFDTSTIFSVNSLYVTGNLMVSTLVSIGVKAWNDGDNIVRVKVEDDSLPGSKAARLRIELTPVSHPSPSHVPTWDPCSPNPDPAHPSAAGAINTPKMLSSKSASAPYTIPLECKVVAVLVHEKGSASMSRMLFRRLKLEGESSGDFIAPTGPVSSGSPVVAAAEREQLENLLV